MCLWYIIITALSKGASIKQIRSMKSWKITGDLNFLIAMTTVGNGGSSISQKRGAPTCYFVQFSPKTAWKLQFLNPEGRAASLAAPLLDLQMVKYIGSARKEPHSLWVWDFYANMFFGLELTPSPVLGILDLPLTELQQLGKRRILFC